MLEQQGKCAHLGLRLADGEPNGEPNGKTDGESDEPDSERG